MRFLLLLPIFICLVMHTRAEIRLPAIFSSHMVLQQNTEVEFWGWAAPIDKITVICSWLPGQEFNASADKTTLRWSIRLTTPPASLSSHTITIKGGWTDLVLSDILFGEVWLCSGQSNMEWQPAWGNVDITEAQYKAADDNGLRFLTVPRQASPEAQADIRSEWQASNRQTMSIFSATAYFFGRELRDRLGIPVGLINASWGGTPIEVWMHEDHFAEGGKFQNLLPEAHPVWRYGRPGSQWNGMIAPLKSLKIKGFLWYQGETNTFNPTDYPALLEQMITDWRADFNDPNLPFYFVQIAPWRYSVPFEGAAVRDAQLRAFRKISQTGMVVISDIGDLDDIHPRNKTDVGKRLAAWALSHTYGIPYVLVCGPLYKSLRPEGQNLYVQFDFVGQGIQAKDKLTGFEIAGADRRFFPAMAAIEGAEVRVWSDSVREPVAVRYGYDNLAVPSLFNSGGLPASTFRSDDWPAFWPKPQVKVTKIDELGQVIVQIMCPDPRFKMIYWLNGSGPRAVDPDLAYILAQGSKLTIAVLDPSGITSPNRETFELFQHLAALKPVSTTEKPSERFPGIGRAFNLVDGLRAEPDFLHPGWQGYEGVSPEWTIDLERVTPIEKLSVGFLAATTNGIFPPKTWTVYVSDNGKNFTEVKTIKPEQPDRHRDTRILRQEININRAARYIRLSAKNIEQLPGWHQMAGKPAWLFVDEIELY